MIGTANLTQYVEEGAKAARDGKKQHDNPYSYTLETQAAYAWDEGFKRPEAE